MERRPAKLCSAFPSRSESLIVLCSLQDRALRKKYIHWTPKWKKRGEEKSKWHTIVRRESQWRSHKEAKRKWCRIVLSLTEMQSLPFWICDEQETGIASPKAKSEFKVPKKIENRRFDFFYVTSSCRTQVRSESTTAPSWPAIISFSKINSLKKETHHLAGRNKKKAHTPIQPLFDWLERLRGNCGMRFLEWFEQDLDWK